MQRINPNDKENCGHCNCTVEEKVFDDLLHCKFKILNLSTRALFKSCEKTVAKHTLL